MLKPLFLLFSMALAAQAGPNDTILAECRRTLRKEEAALGKEIQAITAESSQVERQAVHESISALDAKMSECVSARGGAYKSNVANMTALVDKRLKVKTVSAVQEPDTSKKMTPEQAKEIRIAIVCRQAVDEANPNEAKLIRHANSVKLRANGGDAKSQTELKSMAVTLQAAEDKIRKSFDACVKEKNGI